MTLRSLDSLFNPSSIALVGASKTPGTVGYVLARNLMSAGFDGPIMPVNPKHRAIGGVLTWPNVASLPVTPELAVVSTPADSVPGVVADLREKGTKAAIVVTAGFGEGGDRTGISRAAALQKAAGDVRIVGPNVLGVMVPGIGLNAGFAGRTPLAGDLAFVAQSGAVLASVLDWATARGIGFSHMVSLGDMLDVDFGDMLDYLGRDPRVRAILLYIEAIKDVRKFMSAARAAARMKPVVVVKGGRQPEGARAASSHTGALAGSDAVYDAAFRRAGMLRVTDMAELFDAVETLSRAPRISGERMAILTNGGGMGVRHGRVGDRRADRRRRNPGGVVGRNHRLAGCRPAADLEPRQPGRHHRRRAGRVVQGRDGGAARRQRDRRDPGVEHANGRGRQHGRRRGGGRDACRAPSPGAGLLVGRRIGRRAQAVRHARRANLRHAGRSRAVLHAYGPVSREPEATDAGSAVGAA
jgi:succinyl-CoA synthetase alpha subunit